MRAELDLDVDGPDCAVPYDLARELDLEPARDLPPAPLDAWHELSGRPGGDPRARRFAWHWHNGC